MLAGSQSNTQLQLLSAHSNWVSLAFQWEQQAHAPLLVERGGMVLARNGGGAGLQTQRVANPGGGSCRGHSLTRELNYAKR